MAVGFSQKTQITFKKLEYMIWIKLCAPLKKKGTFIVTLFGDSEIIRVGLNPILSLSLLKGENLNLCIGTTPCDDWSYAASSQGTSRAQDRRLEEIFF